MAAGAAARAASGGEHDRARGLTPLPSARTARALPWVRSYVPVSSGRRGGSSSPAPANPVLNLTKGWIPRLGRVEQQILFGARQIEHERRGRRALHHGRDLAQRRGLPGRAQHPEHHDVVHLVAVAMPVPQHALAAEADALERALGAAVAGVRPRVQPLQPERPEAERRHQRLGLRGWPRCPSSRGRPRSRRSRGGRALASSDEPGDADRAVLVVVDQELEQLAALALAGAGPRCRPAAPRCARTAPTRRSA